MMYNTYMQDQNQQSILSLFCTDKRADHTGVIADPRGLICKLYNNLHITQALWEYSINYAIK